MSWSERFEVTGVARLSRFLPAARVLALIALVSVTWCVMLNRLSLAAWQTPLNYQGDAWVVLSRIKAAAEGQYWPVAAKNVPSLGAPFVANWDAHPTSEDLLYLATGTLARLVGLFPAANLAVLISHVLAAISFYACCRMLRCRWEWSFMGALAFALSPYLFFRSLPHLMLAFAWHVPLLLLACWWLGTRHGLRPGSRRFWLALGIALVTGLQNAYYTFLLVQLAGLAFLAQVIRKNNARQWIMPALVCGVAILGWIVGNADSLIFRATTPGSALSDARPYSDLELYALKPISLLMPPASHHWPALARLGQTYLNNTSLFNEANFAYIGLLGIGATLGLAGFSIARVLRHRRRSLPFQATHMLWIVVFAMPGGLNALLGMAGFTLFRATNRYSIAVLALALMFLAQFLTWISRRWSIGLRLGLAASLGLLATWDQLPRLALPEQLNAIARNVESDRIFVQALEEQLPAGAMVFQLPIAEYPEGASIHNMASYEHLRPYLVSSELRWSFGDDKGNPQFGWQYELAGLAPAELIEALERYGFAAVQINRKAYADRGAALLHGLRAAGRADTIESARGDLVGIRIHPVRLPERPAVAVIFASGWHGLETDPQGNSWRWSSGSARMVLLNSTPTPIARRVSFQISTLTKRHIQLRHGDRILVELELEGGKARQIADLTVTLAPGMNVFSWITDAPARSASRNDPRPLAFTVRNMRIRPQP